MQTTISTMAIPASLQAYVCDAIKANTTIENLRLMVRGWVGSPMVEFEGFGQERLDTFDTMHNLENLITTACYETEEEIQEAIPNVVSWESKQETLENLRKVFQGFVGSPLEVLAADQRSQIVDTYHELQRIVNELYQS